MKLKALKNLKVDTSGLLGSRFKLSRSIKEFENNIYFKLNKMLRRRKIRRNSVFKLRSLMSKVKSVNKNSRNLDFNSTNTKNVFLRTKRKSSYGQTLLEKQKLKSIIPHISEKTIKSIFRVNGNSVVNRLDYVFNISNIFVSKDFVKSKLVLKHSFYENDNFYSFHKNDLKYSNCKINTTSIKQKRFTTPIFGRVIPSNLLFDIRIDKIKLLDGIDGYNFPFNFNVKKVIQHYRLKRS